MLTDPASKRIALSWCWNDLLRLMMSVMARMFEKAVFSLMRKHLMKPGCAYFDSLKIQSGAVHCWYWERTDDIDGPNFSEARTDAAAELSW